MPNSHETMSNSHESLQKISRQRLIAAREHFQAVLKQRNSVNEAVLCRAITAVTDADRAYRAAQGQRNHPIPGLIAFPTVPCDH